jgi:hypothetical protein
VPKRDLVASLELPFHKGSLKVAEGLVFWPALREELFNSIFGARSTEDGPRLLRALARLRPRRPRSRHGALLSGHHPAPPEVADDSLDQRHEDGFSRPVRGPKRVRENCRAPSGMGKSSEANTCSGFASPATTLRRSFTINAMLYVTTLSLDLHPLLEGAVPTATLYPKRRELNNRRINLCLRWARGALYSHEPRG